jgi:hypothetical protein
VKETLWEEIDANLVMISDIRNRKLGWNDIIEVRNEKKLLKCVALIITVKMMKRKKKKRKKWTRKKKKRRRKKKTKEEDEEGGKGRRGGGRGRRRRRRMKTFFSPSIKCNSMFLRNTLWKFGEKEEILKLGSYFFC